MTASPFPPADHAPGRVLTATLPDQDANSANNLVWQYAYDPAGNVLAETDPLGQATTFTYDAVSRR
jgi:YD repeat-containing protein